MQALQFQEVSIRRVLPDGTGIRHYLIRALQGVSLIFVLKRSLLNSITPLSNIYSGMELTYTNSGPLSEREVDVMVSFLLLFLAEPFGIKSVRVGVIVRVMMKSNHGYDGPNSCVQNNVSFWDFIRLRTLAV
jgi:hypothetical protein